VTKRHTIVLDWDGTLVPSRWPEQPTEFMPGAIEAVRRFHAAGHKLLVASARLSPWDPLTSLPASPASVAREKQYIRSTLDGAGLTYVDIWDLPGKPSGSVYVDDKAERYNGRPGSWKAVADKVLLRLNDEAPVFPEFDLEVATA
jgi:hypothetical protein